METFGTSHFVNYREVFLSSEFTCIMERRPQCALLWRGVFSIVSSIHSVLYRRLYSMCMYIRYV